MATSTPSASVPTQEDIRTLLRTLVASYLERPATDIATDAKLVEYGLDSVFALTLCGDIEDEYDIEIESTLAWDYPTIDAITGFLHETLTAKAAQS